MVLTDIPNEDKIAGLFKNLRLQNLTSPYVISQLVFRDIFKEDKTAGLFKNLRLEIFASQCVISEVVLRESLSKGYPQ